MTRRNIFNGFEMAFDRAKVEGYLLRKDYTGLRDEANKEEQQTVIDAVNQKGNKYIKLTLLHDVIKSKKLRSEEAVKILIELGARPTETDANGNTPLHAVASYMNFKNDEDKDIVKALLHTKHGDTRMCVKPSKLAESSDLSNAGEPAIVVDPSEVIESSCCGLRRWDRRNKHPKTAEEPMKPQNPAGPCFCGLKMLLQRNKHLKYPKEIRSIVRECFQILIVEELLYVLERYNDLKLKQIFDFITSNINDFPKDFPSELIEKIIEVETEDNRVHLVLPMLFPAWSEIFARKHMDLSDALKKGKFKSYFMFCALTEINEETKNTTKRAAYEFMDTWTDEQPYVPRDFLPITESYSENEVMFKTLKEFAEKEENVGYLISVAANVTTGDGAVSRLLKVFSKLQMRNAIELRLSGLSLKQLNVHHEVFQDISGQFQFLNFSDNQLTECPAVYKIQEPFQWHKLVKLKLNNNKLRKIDKEIFEMEFLQEINLDDNCLERLPDCEFQSSLQSLHLNDNELVKLPDSLSKSVISSLYLNGNRFESLPPCVCHMFALQYLSLDNNKGIIDFPLEMGNMNPDTRITLANMEQLCYPTQMIEKPKLIINYLRSKLYEQEINRTMNLVAIGPKNHGKTTILNRMFTNLEKDIAPTTEVVVRGSYQFRRRLNVKPFVLNIVDFPGDIEFSANQCFLTNRTVYLLVWNVLEDTSTLSEWLHCLVSANVPDSLVMVVGTFKNEALRKQDSKKWSEDKVEIRLFEYLAKEKSKNEATQFYQKIKFGKWRKDNWRKGGLGLHWFTYVDIDHDKDINKLKRKIREVACSIPLCHTRSYDVKLLGGYVPTFFFYLKDHQKTEKKKSEQASVQQTTRDSLDDEAEQEARADDPEATRDNFDEKTQKERNFLDRVGVQQVMVDGRLKEDGKCCCCFCKNRCGKKSLHIEDRDIDDAVKFLKDTGFLLHFDDVNQSLNDLYFMDLNWLKRLFKEISSNADENGRIRNDQIRMKYNLGDSIIQLIKSFDFGFSISKDVMQLSTKWPIKDDKESSSWKSTAYLCRLHVFEDGSIPFGFWLKVLSRFLLYIDKLVDPDTDTAYVSYRASFDQGKHENKQQYFFNKCRYSKDGFLYSDPDKNLYIFIRQFTLNQSTHDRINYDGWSYMGKEKQNGGEKAVELKGKAFIMTEVMSLDDKVCSYVFTKIINHIEIVIEEWYRNLEGPFSNLPRLSPCTCAKFEGKPCTLYSRETCFRQFHEADYNENVIFPCENDTSLDVPLTKLFPDLLAADCPNIVLKSCHQIKKDRQIGEGGFGIVYQGVLIPCRNRDIRLDAAIKVQKNGLTGDKKLDTISFIEFKNEAVISYHLAGHPFITTFFGVRYSEEGEKGWLMVMERAVDSFSKKLSMEDHLNPILCYRIAYQIADALNFMHSMNIIHRDLKPGNVLFFSDSIMDDINVKLSDFGTACYASSRGLNQSGVGTKHYHPPELFNWKSTYTFAVDIYAYGIILYQLLTLSRPFAGIDVLGLKNIMSNDDNFKNGFKHSKIRKDRICLERLMERCTEYHLTERQMDGKGLIFLLQQPCFQLLMNSLPSSISKDFNLQYFVKRKESSFGFWYISMSEDRFNINLHLSSFKVINSEHEDFLDLRPLETLISPYIIETIHFCDIFDYEDGFIFAMIAETNAGIRLICYRLNSKTESGISKSESQNYLDLVGNKMSTLNHKVLDVLINDVKDIKKVSSTGGFLYLHLEDTEGNQNLERHQWPPCIPEIQEFGSAVVIENDQMNLEPWNICEDIDRNICNAIYICIQEGYKVVAFADLVVIFTSDFEDCGFRKTDEWSLDDENDLIKQLFIYHPYVVILHESMKLTFLKLKKLESQSFSDVVFEVDFKKSHLLSTPNGPCFDIVSSFCGIFNKVWLGTNTGHIFILTIFDETDDTVKQTLIRPYQSPVKALLPFNIQVGGSFPKFVISYGEILEENAFMINISHLQYPENLKKFHLDRSFLGYKTTGEASYSRDLFLMWHATDGKEMEAYEMNTYGNKVINVKLEFLSEHAESCDTAHDLSAGFW